MKRRGVQILRDGKRVYVLVADKVNRFIPNPTFDPVIVPGLAPSCSSAARSRRGSTRRSLSAVEPIHPEYRDRERRLEVMDEQGLAAALMFPTLGCGIEQGLRHDPERGGALPVGVQPLARRGLGIRLPGPHLRRADAVARRPRSGARGARIAARPGRAAGAPAPGSGAGGSRPAVVRPSCARPVLGAPGRGGHPGRLSPRRQRLSDVLGGLGRRCRIRAVPRSPIRSTACWWTTGRSTTRWRRSSLTASSTAIPRCASRASRTVRTGWRSSQNAYGKRRIRCRAPSPRTRSKCCAATCG